jgi:hypothetical protein
VALTSTALDRRLARYRAATRGDLVTAPARANPGAVELARRLAEAIDGEVVRTSEGLVVRAEPPARAVPVDRVRLAALPGQPPVDVPLVCLDTETTGLATAAGTVAFLIGLGWWEHDRFRQVQLLLPEHAEERALLSALAAAISPDAWLVTYNGRGFDWPLLVARYRLAGRAAPAHAGHLDLLPIVRRIFRHRMPNARLRTAEAELLGLHRHGDVDGGEIPERYFGFLRGGPAENLVAVVRHNDQDVRSLARLLGHLEAALGDAAVRTVAPVGDLGGLARAFARERRLGEALACLEMASDRPEERDVVVRGARISDGIIPPEPWSIRRSVVTDPWRPTARAPVTVGAMETNDDAWWSPRRPPDFGGRPRGPAATAPMVSARSAAFDAPWNAERITAERAHLLRRLGRYGEAVEAWDGLAAGPSRLAIVAAVELAKLHEHRLHDRSEALRATARGLALVERRRRVGRPEPALEADLRRRLARLQRRGGQPSSARSSRAVSNQVGSPAV